MTEYEYATKRDRCWNAILKYAVKYDTFLLREVAEEEFSEDDDINYATLRRTARGMQELGWLSRESEKAQNWNRGVLADLVLAKANFRTGQVSEGEIAQEDLRGLRLALAGEDLLDIFRGYGKKEEMIKALKEHLSTAIDELEDEKN